MDDKDYIERRNADFTQLIGALSNAMFGMDFPDMYADEDKGVTVNAARRGLAHEAFPITFSWDELVGGGINGFTDLQYVANERWDEAKQQAEVQARKVEAELVRKEKLNLARRQARAKKSKIVKERALYEKLKAKYEKEWKRDSVN